MKGLSKGEMQAVANLEFAGKYYFSRENIAHLFKDKRQMINTLYTLHKKGRIHRLNRNKYFLVPVKARSGKWVDNPLIIADEMLDGEGYYVGGWYAANYWHLTDQIPFQVDIYTTKRQGKTTIMNTRFVFHRTTRKNLHNAVLQKIEEHKFRILGKEQTRKWMKSRR